MPKRLAPAAPNLPDVAAAAGAGLSEAAKLALRFDWQVFSAWCVSRGVPSLPATPEDAHEFIVEQSKTKKMATLARYRASISKIHKKGKTPSPFATEWAADAWKDIKREKGSAQVQKKAATLLFASAGGSSPAQVRDHAVLTFGLMTALRGTELCALDIDDLEFREEGVVVQIRRSKTDQFGEGRVIGIEFSPDKKTCPVLAVKAWVKMLGTDRGPLFRSLLSNGQPGPHRMGRDTVALVVKTAAAAAGLDPAKFGAHSLRIGYVTEAITAGQDWVTIMEQTGHKKLETVKKYARVAADPFKKSKTSELYKKEK